MITKNILAQMLAYYAQDKNKHNFQFIRTERNPLLDLKTNLQLEADLASGSANTKVIEGKIKFGCQYLVSRGEEIGFGLKPNVVCEYSSHFPFDFCYMYKL